MSFRHIALVTTALTLVAAAAHTQPRKMEHLDRGAIAVAADKGVLISWRILDSDTTQTFDIWRDGKKVKTVKGVSNWLDTSGADGSSYQIKSGKEASPVFKPWGANYLEIALDVPTGGTTPDGKSYTYTANDASVGDLDGDGDYEVILKWEPTNAHDNSQGGYTGNVLLDAYTLEGRKLWRIDLGRNIRAGAHYT